ncbi:MAG: hypothetical protein GY832_21740 [Chloroflexi bacterium]|nr:hypothetical protein [Chloroflexota bacterium]
MASGRLLEHPYKLNVVSLAAPNLHIIKGASSAAADETLHHRIGYMLGIAVNNCQKSLIVGKIPNLYDPSVVAGYFRHWLNSHYGGIFSLVTFAMLNAAVYGIFSTSLIPTTF